MALNKELFKNNLNNIFDLNKTTVNNIDNIAELLTNAIINYLNDVELEPLKQPGVLNEFNVSDLSLIPFPRIFDLTFNASPLTLNVPIQNFSFLIKNALKLDMETNLKNNSISNWNNSNTAFNNFVTSTFVNFKAKDNYIVIGTTTPGMISLSTVFNKFKKNSEEMALVLSNHLHQYFANCTFTGIYSKNLFIGINPHISKLI
jgi:chemotaxis response regulator CheB